MLPHGVRRPPLADAVVRAAAWGDGGADFIYGDGSILSFADHMNTFVAVCPSTHGHHKTKRWSGQRSSGSQQENDNDVDADDMSGAEREMCFTAWTLSGYEDKVRAALDVYNSLSERPRLISTLLPDRTGVSGDRSMASEGRHRHRSVLSTLSSPVESGSGRCGVWREAGPPIGTLLLEKRADLFRRCVVYARVQEVLVAPPDAPVAAAGGRSQQQPEQLQETTTFSIHEVHRMRSGEAGSVSELRGPKDEERRGWSAGASSPRAALRSGSSAATVTGEGSEVAVGTVLELWCALRRVRLTVAVHRETFTVWWPAPVTRPDGSRLPYSSAAGAWHADPLAASACRSPGASAIPPYALTYGTEGVLFTYVEQTFPVCSPPEPWRVMLRMALDLDAELPPAAGASYDGDGSLAWQAAPQQQSSQTSPFPHQPSHVSVRDAAPHGALVDDGRDGCVLALPEPHHWGGGLNGHRTTHPCRFSPLTAAQAAHIAAPRTSRALDAMRALHAHHGTRRAAHLMWLYEANRASSSGPGGGVAGGCPPAVHWCLPASSARECGAAVLAWVAEDGSVVRVGVEGQGYTVVHARLAPAVSAPSVYRIKADGAAAAQHRLPPRNAPLRCRLRPALRTTQQREEAEEGEENEEREEGNGTSTTRDRGSGNHSTGAVVVVDALSLVCEATSSTAGGGERCGVVGVCAALAELTALTPAWRGDEHPSVSLLSEHISSAVFSYGPVRQHHGGQAIRSAAAVDEGRALCAGRYLGSIADVAIQLSQLNYAVSRSHSSAAGPAEAAKGTRQASAPLLAAYCRPIAPTDAGRYPTSSATATSPALHGGGSSCDASLSVDGVVYLTSRLDGVGSFTALTNGTMRAHFDDRAIVTLIPGSCELDESQLLVTGILRSAQRCTIHAAQCRPGHPLFRYLAYLLPFRRYVYQQAASGAAGAGGHVENSPPPQQQQRQQQWCHEVLAPTGETQSVGRDERHAPELQVTETDVHSDNTIDCGAVSPVGVALGHDVDSVCFLPSARMSAVASSPCDSLASLPALDGALCPRDPNARAATQLEGGKVDRVPRQRSPSAVAPPRWGITDRVGTLSSVLDREAGELRWRQERLAAVLADNEGLSRATRALLRDC